MNSDELVLGDIHSYDLSTHQSPETEAEACASQIAIDFLFPDTSREHGHEQADLARLWKRQGLLANRSLQGLQEPVDIAAGNVQMGCEPQSVPPLADEDVFRLKFGNQVA